MNQCTPGNIYSVVIFIVVVMAAVGIWSFHSRYTCASKPPHMKNECVTRWFMGTVGGILLAILAAQLYTRYMEKEENVGPDTDVAQNLA